MSTEQTRKASCSCLHCSFLNEIALLHMDLGHVYCTEDNMLESIKSNINHVAYMHLADIKEGCSIKFSLCADLTSVFNNDLETSKHSYLYYDNGDFAFLSNTHNYYFYQKKIPEFLNKRNNSGNIVYVSIEKLSSLKTDEHFYPEIKAYTDSIPGISLQILNEVKPVLKFLRSGDNPIIKDVVCNTLKGKVHYHERLGYGQIDLPSVLKLIDSLNYEGYITVELYNHTEMWDTTLPESFEYVSNALLNPDSLEKEIINEWGSNVIGDSIDHRMVKPPYIRLAGYKKISKETFICNYDVRFVQPGKEKLSPLVMHSLEHLLIKEFKAYFKEKYVQLAPMGCQTGFYLTLVDVYLKKDIIRVYKEVLQAVLNEQVVPYQTRVQCGNYLEHDLDNAKKAVAEVLGNIDNCFNIL